MSVYEIQALAVAKATFDVYWWADVIAACALVAAIIGGRFAYQTLHAIVGQMKIARWNSLLSFEQDMATRRTKFSDIAIQIKMDLPTTSLKLIYQEAKESYFNSLDRLASSILNGHFPDEEMRQDYQDVITGVVRTFPDDFATGTHYRKVVKLYNQWQDRK